MMQRDEKFMAEKKTKRVFAGYYERYDLVNIHVAMVVDDVDSGEKSCYSHTKENMTMARIMLSH